MKGTTTMGTCAMCKTANVELVDGKHCANCAPKAAQAGAKPSAK